MNDNNVIAVMLGESTLVFFGGKLFDCFQCPKMPEEWKEWVKNVDDVWLIVIVFGIFFINLTIKIYFISVVYRCYKHLLRQVSCLQVLTWEMSN